MELNAKNKKRNFLIAVRLNNTGKKALDSLSQCEGIRMSETVRLLLREGLKARGIKSLSCAEFLMPAGVENGSVT